MEILRDYDLKDLNTFRVPAKAAYFTEVKSEADLRELFSDPIYKKNKKLFLGGGSNVLFTKDFDGIVVQNKLKGVKILKEDDKEVIVWSASGEVWHDLVLFVVERGWWGVENLSFIPGTVGGAPMQNIGAYGAELKTTLESVEAIDVEIGEPKVFKNDVLDLGYRDSIFKKELKGKYFITGISLRLSKTPKPKLEYRHLREYLDKNNIKVKHVRDVSDAVTEIRQTKLPNPEVIPNAGSFFKNIFLSGEEMKNFLSKHPDVPYFEEGGVAKVPAAWLIEQCGWKGKRVGNAGVHDRQALVLVNHGGATGQEIKELAEKIIDSVRQKFGIKLEMEVNLI